MNVSKADKYRYWVALFPDDLEVGQEFAPGKLHITLIPWFVTDYKIEDVLSIFNDLFSNQKQFSLVVGQKENFHPRRSVIVNLIEPSLHIESLHGVSMNFFNLLQGRWAVQNPYVKDQYRPHIRRRDNDGIKEGQLINARSVYLIKARREEDNIREVAGKVELI